MTVRFGVIGYGEAGQIFAAELLENGAAGVAVYDKLFGTSAAEDRIAKAVALGVRVAGSAADAVRNVDVVISAVTADQARNAAFGVAADLVAGQIYLDINSASPGTKVACAERVDAAGADFVEAAVMATIPGLGLKVPILAGGQKAEAAARLLTPLGMNITPISDEIGRASSTKLCRSIMIKGIEALIIQCQVASQCWGVEDDVFASLAKSYPGIDWADLAVRMRGRVNKHGTRRSAEMREAAEMVRMLGMGASLCAGVADVQAAFAGK